MKIIEVNNLYTAFGENVVHNDISFSVNEGEIFGILGGSGSGKSVLVKQIVMLNQIPRGNIKIFDKDISTLSLKQTEDLKLQFSYLLWFGALYSFLNVIENISVMLKEYTNLPKDLIEKIAYTNLDIVGLPKSVAKLYPSQLSGGMKKRVALARSLAMQPKILFLDEPTSGLDPLMQEAFFEILKEEKARGATIFLSSHILSEVKRICDRVGIIKNGQLIKIESMDKITKTDFSIVTIISEEFKKLDLPMKDVVVKERQDDKIKFIYKGNINDLLKSLSKINIVDLKIEEPTLEEVFMHYYK